MLLGTISLSQLQKMARFDPCPQGPPSFPGQGRQRIPQIKVILGGGFEWVGVEVAQNKTVSRSVVGIFF